MNNSETPDRLEYQHHDSLNIPSADEESKGPFVVAVYLVNRVYGGPEEGGWYYEAGHPAPSFAQHTRGFEKLSDATAYQQTIQKDVCNAENRTRRPISSTISEGIYAAVTTSGFPAPFPQERPRWE